MKHFTPRKPRGRHFAWSRIITMDGGLLTYRLFRRDRRGALHQYNLQYVADAPRTMIAGDLKRAKKLLRDKVDEIDLAAMEAA